jgi:hypothetical protein
MSANAAERKYINVIGDGLLGSVASAEKKMSVVGRALSFYEKYMHEMKQGNVSTIISMHNEADGSRAHLREELKLIPDKYDDFRDAGDYALSPVAVWGSYVVIDVSIEWKGSKYPWREMVYCDSECYISNLAMRTDSINFNEFKVLLALFDDHEKKAVIGPGYVDIPLTPELGAKSNPAYLFVNKNIFATKNSEVGVAGDVKKVTPFIELCMDENKAYWRERVVGAKEVDVNLFEKVVSAANDKCWDNAKTSTVMPVLWGIKNHKSVSKKNYLFTAAMQLLSRAEKFNVYGILKDLDSHTVALVKATTSNDEEFVVALPLLGGGDSYVLDASYYRTAEMALIMSTTMGEYYKEVLQ